jgi:hypothetical protein
MKNLVIVGLVTSMLLMGAAGVRAGSSLSDLAYTGRYACQATSQGYYSYDYQHSSSASWIVEPNGRGYYNGGELCANPSGNYGPCECFYYLNTSYSSYYVDYLGFVYETLSWTPSSSTSENSYCPGYDSYFTDHVGGALFFGNSLSITALGSQISDDNTAGVYYPGDGTCSR